MEEEEDNMQRNQGTGVGGGTGCREEGRENELVCDAE